MVIEIFYRKVSLPCPAQFQIYDIPLEVDVWQLDESKEEVITLNKEKLNCSREGGDNLGMCTHSSVMRSRV